MAQIVYRAEAKGIQDWILSSDRLQELKGGSAIVDELPQRASRLIVEAGGSIISCAAGAIEARLPDEHALQQVATVWPMLVELHAPGLTLVQAWVAEVADPKATRTKLMTELAKARNLASPSLPLAGPFIARSARTGLPASKRLPKGGESGLADPAVARKVAAVRQMQKIAARDPFDALLSDQTRSFVEDTSRFTDTYVAVVHIDGNAIGERIMQLPSGTLPAFSTALTEATRNAARSAFDGVRTDEKRTDTVLARPIVLGGDDLTAIVAADQAISFVSTYLQAFTRLTASAPALGAPEGLTAAAGIALVKVGFPFHAAHELAESLCKGAKQSGAPNEAASRILFHRITTANPELAWEEILTTELAATGPDAAPARLSAGPYDLTQIARLQNLYDAMQSLPRGAMREWLRLVAEEPNRAQAFWDRMQEVARARTPKTVSAEPSSPTGADRNSGSWQAFSAALVDLGHNPENGWRVRDGIAETALLDAALLKFLTPSKEAK